MSFPAQDQLSGTQGKINKNVTKHKTLENDIKLCDFVSNNVFFPVIIVSSI